MGRRWISGVEAILRQPEAEREPLPMARPSPPDEDPEDDPPWDDEGEDIL